MLEIASDPVKWKQAMHNAKKQIEKLREQRDAVRSKSGGAAPFSVEGATAAASADGSAAPSSPDASSTR